MLGREDVALVELREEVVEHDVDLVDRLAMRRSRNRARARDHRFHVEAGELEGTARGAWVLSRWTGTRAWAPKVEPVAAPEDLDLKSYQKRWLARLARP